MHVQPLALADILLLVPQKMSDSRGYFVETYNEQTLRKAGIECRFIQDNQSLSTQVGTIRGFHLQRAPHAQAKLVRVVQGAIYDVAVDVRKNSPTYGQWCAARLTANGGEQLFIPTGFAHAFCTLVPDTVVAYKVSAFYARDCEGGIRWNDPDLAVDWPVTADEAHVSDKDASLPALRDFASSFQV